MTELSKWAWAGQGPEPDTHCRKMLLGRGKPNARIAVSLKATSKDAELSPDGPALWVRSLQAQMG
jgi:hypothetical protein